MHDEKRPYFSRRLIDKYLLDLLDDRERDKITHAMEQDAGLKAAIERRKDEAEGFLRQFPSFQALDGRCKPANPASARRKSSFLPAGRMALTLGFGMSVAVMSLFVLLFRPDAPVRAPDSILVGKGVADVGLVVKRQKMIIRADSDSVFCMPADTLQFFIRNPQPVYYAIYSQSKDGIKRYLPVGDTPAKAGSRHGEPVSRSIILSGDWTGEVIKVVYSKQLFTLGEALRLVRRQTQTDSSRLHISTYTLKSGRPR